MTDIFNFIIPFVKEIFFEGKDYQHFINILTNTFDPAFFPRPNLRRNIINGFKTHFPGPGCYAQVKARIINKDDGVGFEPENIGLAKLVCFSES